MTPLSTPSKELALRILSEVDFDQRIEGFRLRERAGIIPTRMYSFSEVVGFLSDSFPKIDFTALSHWIRSVMKDPELSDRVMTTAGSDASDLDKTRQIRDLMGLRLVQSKKII